MNLFSFIRHLNFLQKKKNENPSERMKKDNNDAVYNVEPLKKT